MSVDRTLFEGIMINGSIDAEISPEIAKLSDWKLPIGIGIKIGQLSSDNSIIFSYFVIFEVQYFFSSFHKFVRYLNNNYMK
jgi:hypothetical protein